MNYSNIISVIVCTYNQEKTIGRALDSILRQRCSWPVEILIGEDCSSDQTREVCQRYAELYPGQIRLFVNPKNKGLLDNYYDCLLCAKGKYIADLAGDDEWCDPYKLEKELQVLEQHPEVVLVHTDYRLLDSDTNTLRPAPFSFYPRKITDGKVLTSMILTQKARPVIHLCTAMYRTEAFRQCYEAETDLFRNHAYPCEDLQLCALLSRMGDVAYLDHITLNYNISNSISNTGDDVKQFDFVRRATQLSYDLQQRLHLPMDARLQAFYNYRIYALLMHAFRSHRKDLREDTRKCAYQWQAQQEFRSSVIIFLTSNELLWRLSLSLRKQLLKLFRH